ncbi:hypothetical protein Q8A73_007223 [Channa argus]|nr:hypothetical protein Q8A73_007223 [Channa argus]
MIRILNPGSRLLPSSETRGLSNSVESNRRAFITRGEHQRHNQQYQKLKARERVEQKAGICRRKCESVCQSRQSCPRSLCRSSIIVQSLRESAPVMQTWTCGTWLNTRLYTPKSTDHEKCPSSTLKCFAAEVKVLTEEWMEVVENFPRLKLDKMLYTLASTFKQAESDCPECELLQEENAENFLNCLLSTLQCMNSLYCNR